MRNCAKCDWLGIIGPCPHEGEPFPIYTQRRPAQTRYIPSVVEFIEHGVHDFEDEDTPDFDPEDKDAGIDE